MDSSSKAAILERQFVEPFISPIDLTWLQDLSEYRIDEEIRVQKERIRAQMAERNSDFAHHNWQRTLCYLDDLRAGIDVSCDNLAQYQVIQEIINDHRQLLRQRDIDARGDQKEIGKRYREQLRKLLNPSEEKLQAKKPNPFLVGSDPETSGLGGKNDEGPDAGISPKSPTKNFPQPEWAPLFPNANPGKIFGSQRRDQLGNDYEGIELEDGLMGTPLLWILTS